MKVKRALDAAFEAPPEHRTTVLERLLAGEDPALIADAETYLDLQEEIGDFIEKPPVSLSAHGSRDPMEGRRVGPYKLERLLGRGGMGAVYLAVREDDYEKRAALKLIHQALSTREVVDRFRKERQILAHLEHPNIARLLDGGTTREGLPYFVMEYVEGEPIDRFCDQRRLTTRERLTLFRQVCSAVHFAHRNLVVHRDLKPGNILVGADGVPKLLDFGIAKLLGTESVTRLLDRDLGPMTYQYASPEQILGEPITTASDVYALGVLLYELLTGHLPLKRDQYRHPMGIIRAIGRKDPPKPSTAIWREEYRRGPGKSVVRVTAETVSGNRDGDPARLRRVLSGDVDAVVLKTLRREPEHRYSSVEQLSEDIRRHLDGHAVEALSGSFSYRAGKYVRRNRLALATAAAFLVMVIGFVVTLAVQLRKTQTERNRARMAMDLLVEYLEGSEDRPSDSFSVEEILQRGIDRFDEAFAGDLEAQANTLNHLGLVYSYRGSYDKAEMLLQGAVDLRRRKWGDDHPLVAESLLNQAHLLGLRGEHEQAEPLSREALRILRRHFKVPDRLLAKAMSNQAARLQALEDYEGAQALYLEALAMKRELFGSEHLEVATTLANLGTLLYIRGDYEAARHDYRQALTIRARFLPPEHPRLATTYSHMGRALFALGDYDAAVPMFRNALVIRTSIHGSEHPEVTVSLNNLAFSLARIGELDESESLYEKAMKIRIEQFGEGHVSVATVKRNLAALHLARGDPGAAEPLAREAYEVFQDKGREGHWRTADARSVLGACLGVLGRREEAEKMLLESYEDLLEKKGEGDLYVRDARRRIADLYMAWDRPDRAAEYRAGR